MKYRHAFRVDAAPDEVAAFHVQALSLQAITPPLMPMRLHRAPDQMVDGAEMEFTLWLGPIPVRWHARVEDVSPAGFVDRQVSGPFAQWVHRHTFLAMDGGATQVVDQVEARVRRHLLWGPVGLAMWLGLPLLFAYRGWRTRRLLERDAA